MAVQQGYGKMAGANSLVFAYDTTDTKNSFKGAPTSNLLETDSNWSYIGATITDPNNYPVPLPSSVKFYTGGSNGGLNWTDACRNYVDSYPAGTKITVSGWHMVYTTDTSLAIDGRLRLGWHYNKDGVSTYGGTIYTVTEWNKWTYFSHTFSSTGVTTNLRVEDGGYDYYLTAEDAAKTSQYYCNLQIEIGNGFASPYVKGTRSNEEAILDLTGNHTVDVSTLDFTEGFELDGTDDHMTFNLTKTPNMTFEFITNYSSASLPDSEMVFNAGNGAQGPDLYLSCGKLNWNIWDGCNNPFATIPRSWNNGKNHHVVLVNDQTNNITKLYYDGALLGTATYRQCTADNMSIGGNSTGYNYRGNLPLFKVYSEALTEAQVQSNFKNYRKRFEGLDYHIDDTTDGGGWIRWWWYTGVGWPGHEPEALGHLFGTFDSSSHYGFQRLPEGLEKEQVELLAKDGDGNIYKWDFASPSATAQQVWDSFTQGTQGSWNNSGDAWNPIVIAGAFHGRDQDAWKYRVSEGVASFLLDDDGCDCLSTLNAGHAMCGGSWNQQYAQPDGAYLRYGVDTLNDGGCLGPLPERTLELYYRLK